MNFQLIKKIIFCFGKISSLKNNQCLTLAISYNLIQILFSLLFIVKDDLISIITYTFVNISLDENILNAKKLIEEQGLVEKMFD